MMFLDINSMTQNIGWVFSLIAVVVLGVWVYRVYKKELVDNGLSFDQIMANRGPTLFKALGGVSTILEVIGLAIIGMSHPVYPMNPFSAVARYGSVGFLEAVMNFFFQAVLSDKIEKYVADGKFSWWEKVKAVLFSLPWFIVATMTTHLIAILYTESTGAFHLVFSGQISTPWNMFKIEITQQGLTGLVHLDASALIMIYLSQFIDGVMVIVMMRIPREEWEAKAKAAGRTISTGTPSTSSSTPAPPHTPPPPVPPVPGSPPSSGTPPIPSSGTPPSTPPPTPPPTPATATALTIDNSGAFGAFVSRVNTMIRLIYNGSITAPGSTDTLKVNMGTGNNIPLTAELLVKAALRYSGLEGAVFNNNADGTTSVDISNLSLITTNLTGVCHEVASYINKVKNAFITAGGPVSNTAISSQTIINAANSVSPTPGVDLTPAAAFQKFVEDWLFKDHNRTYSHANGNNDGTTLLLTQLALIIANSSSKSSILATLEDVAAKLATTPPTIFKFFGSPLYNNPEFATLDSDISTSIPPEIQDHIRDIVVYLYYSNGNPIVGTRSVDRAKGLLISVLRNHIPQAVTYVESNSNVAANFPIAARALMVILNTANPQLFSLT